MDEIVTIPKPFFLGVLGTNEGATREKITDIMLAILHNVERFPERLILPAEGKNNIFLQDWAEKHTLHTQIYEADWFHHAKRAVIFRDTRIIKESTHFLIFLNKRSDANEKTAQRLARQGNMVFTISYADWAIEQLVIQVQEVAHPKSSPSLKQPSARSKGRGSKRDTGKERELKQSEPLERPGSQIQLTDLWEACRIPESQSCQ